MREGWKYVALDDAVRKGSSNISLNKIREEKGDYPVYGAKGFVKNVSFFQQEKDYLAIIKDGAGIGRVSTHPGKSSVLATMQYLIPKDGFAIGFIQHFLNSIDFEKYRNGSTIPHIYFKDYKDERIPVLPLAEQKRIVAILDEAFARIATAVANTEKNLANARELFESYLTAVFEGLEEECKVCALSDLGRITSSKRIFKSEYTSSGIPFFRTKEIKQLANGKPITTELFISEDRYNEIESSFGVPRGGDLLMTAIGTIGEIYVKKEGERFYFKDGNVLWLKDFREINPYFLKYMLRSFVENLKRLSHGAAYNALPIEKLKGYEIPVPSLTHQERLLDDINEIESSTKRLELVYQQKLNALTELKQSLLQKAFCGELTAVPQEEIETALA